jgi:hypothetical protein
LQGVPPNQLANTPPPGQQPAQPPAPAPAESSGKMGFVLAALAAILIAAGLVVVWLRYGGALLGPHSPRLMGGDESAESVL